MLIAQTLSAQGYPARPITVIAPWPAGGAIDALCRALGPKLAERLGQPVVIENRPGAASTLGVAAGGRANPDGYTLVMAGSGSLAIAPTAYSKLPYDPTKDFAPIGLVATIPFVLVVNPTLPIKSVAELVKYAKEKPGQLNYGSGGAGSPHHLLTEIFKNMTGIDMAHVPYKGSAPALNDVVGGHIQVLFSDPLPSLPQIQAGNVRALGVSSIARWPAAPDISTIAEAGVPGFDAAGWGMLVAPVATPNDIVIRLHAELKAVLGSDATREQIEKLGMVPAAGSSREELQPFINSEIERWGKIVKQNWSRRNNVRSYVQDASTWRGPQCENCGPQPVPRRDNGGKGCVPTATIDEQFPGTRPDASDVVVPRSVIAADEAVE
jgi:tripartite-type tricarboxylate transporter receptor subunit TctC